MVMVVVLGPVSVTVGVVDDRLHPIVRDSSPSGLSVSTIINELHFIMSPGPNNKTSVEGLISNNNNKIKNK